MKLAIMQPYFFPYIGYWQLISAVDTFVIFDDVNFIKQGWINRNTIIGNDSNHLISLQLIGASSFKLINEVIVGNNAQKILKTVEQTYKKAPYFEKVYPLIQEVLLNEEKNLAKFLIFSITKLCVYLEIKTNITVSSELIKNNDLKGQDKILNICEVLKAKQYINAIGGQELYQKKAFHQQSIELLFIKNKPTAYPQFQSPFIPNLSIIDVMMFNDKEQIKQYLTEFELI
jgi:WbqC-like protein